MEIQSSATLTILLLTIISVANIIFPIHATISPTAPMSKVQEEILKEGYLYLQTIGVSPELQGQGFGSKLLRAIFEYADNEGFRIHLEATEENVPLYEKFGFQVIKEIKLSTIDLLGWAMVREPS